MKKVILMWMMAVEVMTATAQVEQMVRHAEKADPMRDNPGMTYWESRHVCISETKDGKYYLSIFNPQYVFTEDDKAKVGFYNQKGKLIFMSERWQCIKGDGATQLWLEYGFTKDSTKYSMEPDPCGTSVKHIVANIEKYRIVEPRHVLQFLKENRGYIRIVTPIYYNGLFDKKATIRK